MAQVRTSGKQAAARKAARERAVERAAEFRRRQDELESLAVEYFVLQDALEGIDAAAEMEIQEIRDRAAAQTAETASKVDQVVRRMLDTKVTREEVAERLGIPLRDVKRRKPAVPAADASTSDDAATGDVQEHSPVGEQQSHAA